MRSVLLSSLAATALLAAAYACGDPGRLSQDPRFTGSGDTECAWGSRDCNRCVEGVKRQVQSMGVREPTGRFTFWLGAGSRLPGLDGVMDPIQEVGGGHIQGFARIPAFDGNNWVVMSRSHDKGEPAGLIFGKMGDVAGQLGERLVPPWVERDAFWVDNPPPVGEAPPEERANRAFLHIPETRHPGGIQVIGRIVVVPSYCKGGNDDCRGEDGKKRAFVDFWEMRLCEDDRSRVCPVRAARRLLLKRAGLGGFLGIGGTRVKAYYVAIARLDTGHYVLFVNRSDAGHFDVYLSSNTTIDMSTEWVNWDRERFLNDFDNFRGTYQNMNFVTDCETGELYALGMRQDHGWDDDSNTIDLFRAWAKESGELDLDRINKIHPRELDDACEMKGGANVYVSPRGELILYCSQGKTWIDGNQDERFLAFSEHTSLTYPECVEGPFERFPCPPSGPGTVVSETFSVGNGEGRRITAPGLSGNDITLVSVLDYLTGGDDDFAYRVSDAGDGEYAVWTRDGNGSSRLRLRLLTLRLSDAVETERLHMPVRGGDSVTRSLRIQPGNTGVVLVEPLEYDPVSDDDFEYEVEVAEPVASASGGSRIDVTGVGRFADATARATFRLTLLQWPETESIVTRRRSLNVPGKQGPGSLDVERGDLLFTAPTAYRTDRDDDLEFRTHTSVSSTGATVESEATRAGSSASVTTTIWTLELPGSSPPGQVVSQLPADSVE